MGHKYGHVQLRDSLQSDGLWCSLCDWGMGNAAEFIARELEVTREEMDELRLSQPHERRRRHRRAASSTPKSPR